MLQIRRYRKLDPLSWLAALVALGALVTTAAHAALPQSAMHDRTHDVDMSQGLTSANNQTVLQDGVLKVADVGAKGATVGVALRQPRSLRRALAAGGDPGTGRVNERGATVYVTFGTRW